MDPQLQQAPGHQTVPFGLQQHPASHSGQPSASSPDLGRTTTPTSGKGSRGPRGPHKRSKARESIEDEENRHATHDQKLAKAMEKYNPAMNAPPRNPEQPLTAFSGALVSVLPAIAGEPPQPRAPRRPAPRSRSRSPQASSSTKRTHGRERTSRLSNEEAIQQDLARGPAPRQKRQVTRHERDDEDIDEDGPNARRVRKPSTTPSYPRPRENITDQDSNVSPSGMSQEHTEELTRNPIDLYRDTDRRKQERERKRERDRKSRETKKSASLDFYKY